MKKAFYTILCNIKIHSFSQKKPALKAKVLQLCSDSENSSRDRFFLQENTII